MDYKLPAPVKKKTFCPQGEWCNVGIWQDSARDQGNNHFPDDPPRWFNMMKLSTEITNISQFYCHWSCRCRYGQASIQRNITQWLKMWFIVLLLQIHHHLIHESEWIKQEWLCTAGGGLYFSVGCSVNNAVIIAHIVCFLLRSKLYKSNRIAKGSKLFNGAKVLQCGFCYLRSVFQ